jgi:hypothetical protein
MPGGKWGPVQTFYDGQVLHGYDLNAELANIIINQVPLEFDSFSETLAQMELTENPATVTPGSTLSLADEIMMLRYMIQQITGGAEWFSPVTKPIIAVGDAADVAFYLPFESTEAGTTGVFSDSIQRGIIINAASRTAEDINATVFSTAEAAQGMYSYQVGGGSVLAYPGRYGSKDQGTMCLQFYGYGSSQWLAYNPLLGVELFLDGSGKLNARTTLATSATPGSKDTNLVTGLSDRHGIAVWHQAALSWSNNSVLGATTDQLSLSYDNVAEGTQLSALTTIQNGGPDSNWFIGAGPAATAWRIFSSMATTPNAEIVPWNVATSGAVLVSLTNGVMNLASAASNSGNIVYSLPTVDANSMDLTHATVEFKMRIDPQSNSCAGANRGSGDFSALMMKMRRASIQRGLTVEFTTEGMILSDSTTQTIPTSSGSLFIPVNFLNWQIVRMTFEGATNPVVTVYINGLNVATFTLNTADATANDTFEYGIYGSLHTTQNVNIYYEYVAFNTTAAIAPIAASSSGYLDEVVLTKRIQTSTILGYLLDNSAKVVYNSDVYNGPTILGKAYPIIPYSGITIGASSILTGPYAAQYTNQSWLYFPSDGKTPIRIYGRGSINRSNGGSGVTAVYVALSVDGYGIGTIPLSCSGLPFSVVGSENIIDNTAGNSLNGNASMEHELILPVGLHYLSIIGGMGTSFVAGSTAQLQSDWNWGVSRA